MYSVLLFGDFLLVSSLTSILTCEGKLPVIFRVDTEGKNSLLGMSISIKQPWKIYKEKMRI